MPAGKSLRSPRYTKSPRTPRSAHAKFYYTPSLIVHSPRLDAPIEQGCDSTANLMENHSRSASPREAPRPQHRPPSPPTPLTVPSAPTAPSAFDNRAYQHDEADPNHNDSFTSNTPQNGHSKEPNGETKTPEAVNLELINLTPKNGKAKKKDVELDMNSANPYDEYFVSVNEHRKYMRGEKLYVTADKRGEKGGCKRPLCWSLLALVVATVIALIVLAATGILTSSSPTTVDNYNSSLSSARAFGGLTPSEHDHTHDHEHDHDHDHTYDHDHDHDHTYGHDHDAHDGHAHADNASNEAEVAQNDEDVPALEDSNESAMYVPRTLEGQLRIDNEEYTQALSDPDSEEYHQFVATFGEELRRALFNRSMLEDSNNDINVQVIELRNGSIIVTYRVHWKPKFGLDGPKDLMTASSLKSNLEKYLDTNGRMISVYHIAEDKMKASNVLDLCHINNNDCSHGCLFDEKSLDFICTCPRGQILDMHNPKKCISIFDYSDQEHNQEPKTEVKGLEVSSNSETKEVSPNPVSVNIAEHEHTIDWKDNEPVSDESTTETDNDMTRFSHVFGHPEEPEPSSERKSGEHTWEPKPTLQPEPTAEPTSESELAAEPKADPEISAEPKSEPEPTAEPNAEPEPSAEPKVEPEISAEPQSESVPTAEPKSEPEPTSEPNLENEPTAEPKSEPEPIIEPKSEPEPTAEPKSEPESITKSKSEPEPTAEPKLELEHTADLKAESETTAEPKAEAEPTPELKLEPKPATEVKLETEDAAAEPKAGPPLSEPNLEPQPTTEPKLEPEPTPEPKLEIELTVKPKPSLEPATEAKPISGQQQEGESEPISKPKPNAIQQTTIEAKSEPESNHQNELAIKTKIAPELTAESNTSTSTADHSSEPEPAFIPNLAGIMGVEPELVFSEDSEHTEDTETVMKPTTNHTTLVLHQPLSETVSEQNMSSDETYLEGKPTDYFNILNHVDREMLKTVDTTTTQSSIVQNETVEDNSDKKDPAFFAIFQQDNEHVTDTNSKTESNKNNTDKSDTETTTKIESSLDALHEQVYKNVLSEIPEKTRKINDHILLNDSSSTIKPDKQTTDENVDPLFILFSDKSMSESTTAHNKIPFNSTIKEDFILGPLIESTTVKVAIEPTQTATKENSNSNDNMLGPLVEATTVTVAKIPTEADKTPIYITPVTENSKILYVLDDGSFFNKKDTKQTEAITGLEPVTESFLTENENNTEIQEVGANSERKNGLLPNLITTESDMPEATEITFNMLLNRSSKAIIDSDNSNQISINVTSPVNETTTTESEWLSEPVTEISYEHLMNRLDKQLTTESSANAVDKVINGGQINDFEPDYLTHLSPTYAPEPNELLYTAMSDYDSQEARVKRVNQEEKESKPTNDMKPEVNISLSSSDIHGVQEITNTFDIPKENNNAETTTVTHMDQNSSTKEPMKKFTVNTINDYIYRTTEKQQSEPAPVWEESDVETDTTKKEILASKNEEQKPFPATTTTVANSDNNTQENLNQENNSTQINNLNVTIYEKPLNQSQSFTTTKSPVSHSAEYDEHDKETNPFLPEVENNNSLVKKLQEGHDLEPSHLNDTQNDNMNEQSTLLLDSIKSHNESDNFASVHQTKLAATTEDEDSIDDLLRESSRELKPNTTERGINRGDENIHEDGLALSTFLLDTDDLEIQPHKSADTESTAESDFTTNSPGAEDEDYLSVVPVSIIGKSSGEKEVSKKKYKSENIEDINDIVIDFSHKKSDKRTFNELNTSK